MGIGEDQAINLKNKAAALAPFGALGRLLLGHAEELAEQGIIQQTPRQPARAAPGHQHGALSVNCDHRRPRPAHRCRHKRLTGQAR